MGVGGPEPGRRSTTTQEFLKRPFESQEAKKYQIQVFSLNQSSGFPGGHLESNTHTLVSGSRQPRARANLEPSDPGLEAPGGDRSSRKEQRNALGGGKVHVEQVYHTTYTSAHLRWLERAG